MGRDGALSGSNLDLYRALADRTSAAVVCSGGVATVDDIVALVDASAGWPNIEGAVVGAALAVGRFTLREALAAAGGCELP